MIIALALASALAAAPAPPKAGPPPKRAPAAAPARSTPPAAADDDAGLFPAIEPFREGMLKVSDLHTIRWEASGNPKGQPVMVLHGGPGAGASPRTRRLFDPQRWLVVQHDQRGSGKSTPRAELRENTTDALVADIERLREHLAIEKMIVAGGSWGATLALAYAERHPDRVAGLVLRGVFTCTKREIDHFYHGGTEPFFPDAYADLRAVIPRPESRDWPRQLLELTTSADGAVRDRAALAWALYETRMSAVGMTRERAEKDLAEWGADKVLPFSRIESHYLANGCFVEEGQLLRDLPRLAGIPAVLVQGRYDVICPPLAAWQVHQGMPRSRLVLVEDAGHTGSAPQLRKALQEAIRSFEPAR
ncbi:MAG TPA: prolyl aminopeptidase [Anaeromyxobacter sp.]|nr:prolyl aminopeptidase [Anaeromyxobacter sp.]